MKNVLLLGQNSIPVRDLDNRLSKAGCRVVTKCDDHAMLSLQEDGLPVDLVIVDHQAPADADDASLLLYLRQVAPRVPVIVLSDSRSVETYLKALAYGALEYLNKPVNDDVLRTVLATVLGGGKSLQNVA